MKKILTILIAIFFIPVLNAVSQESDTVKLFTIYPGYVVTLKNDTIHGYLLLKNKIANQTHVHFFQSPDDEKPVRKYKPNDIVAYRVANRDYVTQKFSPPNTTVRYSFLLRVINGPISVYKAYYDDKERIKIDEDNIWNSKIDFSFSEAELKEITLGKRESEKELQNFDSMGYLLKFKKNMADYVKDYPELAQKIAAKTEGYEWINLEKIVREYNEWVLRNKK